MGAPSNATTNWAGTQTGRLPSATPAEANKPKSKRGFASMDPERQRQIASLGGTAAHKSGNAHEFTSEEASRAGKLRHSKNRRPSQYEGNC